jgi:ABC-type lipoprotein export system ATPase subunit
LLLDTDRRINAREAREIALQALADVGLEEQADQLPGELSGGQRQRVTIARALVNKPAIVWADEPTGDLDSKTSQDIVDLMRRLNQENGQTFVIVTHSEEIGRQADRIIWMRDGLIEDRAESVEPELVNVNGNGVSQAYRDNGHSNGHQDGRRAPESETVPEFRIAVEPVAYGERS